MTELLNIHIQGGRVIDPANGHDAKQDIFVSGGKITGRDKAPDGFAADITIDAGNRIVCPGLVDLSVRMREPGQENKATLKSESAAAAAGGITTACTPPDTTPIIDNPAMANLLRHRGAEIGLSHILPIGALTNQLAGETLSDMHALHKAGCVAFSNANAPITNTMIMRRAMEYASSFDLLIILHANDPWLTGDGCMHEGEISTRLGLAGIRDRARAQLEGETDSGKRDFLSAVEISYDAACVYVTKYAHLAREMAAGEPDPVRRDELRGIATVCDELSTTAPTGLYSALQLVQFVRVLGGRGCIGRFDQWLYPFYRDDVGRGVLTPDDALELLEDLFLKMNYFPAA